MNAVQSYFSRLSDEFSAGWNQFWFVPRDPMTLCVLRVLTGLLSLYYVASHTLDLNRWFGPYGLLPAGMVRQPEFTGPTILDGASISQASFHISYLSWITDSSLLWVAHAVALLVVLAFTLGLFSRITNVLSVLVVLSYVHRAPMITGQFEPVLSMLLIYLCIGPSGAYLSLDALLKRRRAGAAAKSGGDANGGDKEASAAPRVPACWTATVSQRLIQLHLAGFYLTMGLTMLAGETWWGGDAVWWLAAHTESRLVRLTFLSGMPLVYNAWTHLIVLYQLTFPLLAWNRLARPLLLAWGVLMWVSLALLTGLVPFCLAMLTGNLSFVRPESMARLLERQPPLSDEAPTGSLKAAAR
jgi:hypothetical protein